jgi:predicted GH43/DUF377 family glycosyl hydrolase
MEEIKKSGIVVENQYRYGTNDSLTKYAIENDGSIHPLLIDCDVTSGTGLMNPSIINVNGKIIVNIRHVNYTFYHSEKKLFQHPWGPLTYLHPENDLHLRTWNYYGELNEKLELQNVCKIDTSQFDTYEPKWDFVGLEDARLINWNKKIYITGVRRDTTTNGQGRMELSEILVSDNKVVECSRFRIPPPNDKDSYCEKNWMPVVDQEFTYVKWSNPTEVVLVDPILEDSKTIHLGEAFPSPNDFRGGSQVIPYGNDHYIALTHEVDLFSSEVGRKDAVYRHRFLIWDKNWKIVKYTKDFSLMNGHVEFSAGMCYYNNDVLITFGFQDNAAFILRIPIEKFERFINDN